MCLYNIFLVCCSFSFRRQFIDAARPAGGVCAAGQRPADPEPLHHVRLPWPALQVRQVVAAAAGAAGRLHRGHRDAFLQTHHRRHSHRAHHLRHVQKQ